MLQFDWKAFDGDIGPKSLFTTRAQTHRAIQAIAAVGRKFLAQSDNDENASLSWVPGLSRLAGKWVSGNIVFRASLSFEDFVVYLVDEKINVIASFSLIGKTQNQLLIWLEEQIGKLGLDATDLTLNLPYKIQEYKFDKNTQYSVDPKNLVELSKYFLNSYISIRELAKKRQKEDAQIITWPHHFDQALQMLIKDTGDAETNSVVSLGMSPGDEEFDQPYFYVNSWPHVDTSKFEDLPDGAIWHEGSWTGGVLLAEHVTKEKKQKEIIDRFYSAVSSKLTKELES